MLFCIVFVKVLNDTKKNKTEEEILAAKEFKKFMAETMTMIVVFIEAVFITVSMLISTLN